MLGLPGVLCIASAVASFASLACGTTIRATAPAPSTTLTHRAFADAYLTTGATLTTNLTAAAAIRSPTSPTA